MRLTGQAAIEAKRESSVVVLCADYNGKTFTDITEDNATEVISRVGSSTVWADIGAQSTAAAVEAYRLPKTKEQIVIERHTQHLAGKGIWIRMR